MNSRTGPVALPDVRPLFGNDVATCVLGTDFVPPPLFDGEAEAVAAAVEARQTEFAVGRHCARVALAALGAPPQALPRGAAGATAWPRGYTGSISHCARLCCAAVARTGDTAALGLDVELAQSLEEEVVRQICRPEELQRIAGLPAAIGFEWPNVIFGAKEAVYKCLFVLYGKFFGFEEVSLQLETGTGTRQGTFNLADVSPAATGGRPLCPLSGRWKVEKGYVLAGLTAY